MGKNKNDLWKANKLRETWGFFFISALLLCTTSRKIFSIASLRRERDSETERNQEDAFFFFF